MPTVTYIGVEGFRRRRDMAGEWDRGVSVGVSQAWLDEWRFTVDDLKMFRIEGDNTDDLIDEVDDGMPDSGWTKKQLAAWLKDKSIATTGYMTKTKMLAMAGNVLNPEPTETPDEEPEMVEESKGDEE